MSTFHSQTRPAQCFNAADCCTPQRKQLRINPPPPAVMAAIAHILHTRQPCTTVMPVAAGCRAASFRHSQWRAASRATAQQCRHQHRMRVCTAATQQLSAEGSLPVRLPESPEAATADIAPASVSVVLLAGGVGKRMGVCPPPWRFGAVAAADEACVPRDGPRTHCASPLPRRRPYRSSIWISWASPSPCTVSRHLLPWRRLVRSL